MNTPRITPLILLPLIAAGCARQPPASGAETRIEATAVLETRTGKTLARARFLESPHGLLIFVDGRRLEPFAVHALHVHEGSYCGPDLQGAEGHFSPSGQPHGDPGDPTAAHHAGDLPNLYADDRGHVSTTLLAPDLSLDDGDHAVLGRTLVLHASADDHTTQPSGASGKRVACGAIHED